MDFEKLNTPGGHLVIFLLMIVLCGLGYILKLPNAGEGMAIFTALLIHQMNPSIAIPTSLSGLAALATPLKPGEPPK